MKNQKGITLITLTITIVVMIILTFTITVNVEPYKNQRIKTNFETDMQRLTEEISQYYARVKDIPIINKFTNTNMLEEIKNVNDNDEYYVIDLSQLDVELNYGLDYDTIANKEEAEEITDLLDVYIINKQSHTIYYPKGIEYDDTVYYTIEQEYNEIQDLIEILRDNKIYLTEEKELQDGNGNKIVIPEGFKIAEDSGLTVEEGIVIEDDDIIEGVGNNRGNQYVWIPVGEGIKKSDNTTVDITLGRYTFASNGTETLVQSAENYLAETAIETYYKELVTSRIGKINTSDSTKNTNTTALDLKGFIDSVKTNGGYYIARYEASYGTDGKVNSKVSNGYSDTTVPTAEGMLWNWITQIDAATASRGLYDTTATDLINSYAWDTALLYIQKFSEDTDYSRQNSKNTSLANTGVNGDEVCKINDMASNTDEWTTEYSTSIVSSIAYSCTSSGGDFGNSGTYASRRRNHKATQAYNTITFRSVLYMK